MSIFYEIDHVMFIRLIISAKNIYMIDYFEKILQAKVYEVAKTPLEKANNLSITLKNEVFLKEKIFKTFFHLKLEVHITK